MQPANINNLDKASFVGKTIQDINIYRADNRVQVVLTLTDGTSPSIVLDESTLESTAGAAQPVVEQVDTPWDSASSQDQRPA